MSAQAERVKELEAALEEPHRAGKRQASPFSKGGAGARPQAPRPQVWRRPRPPRPPHGPGGPGGPGARRFLAELLPRLRR
jgi:hypothetical protein